MSARPNQKLHSDLSMEDREALAELVTSAGWKPLLKLIERLVVDQETAVIRHSIDAGVDKLVHLKLKSEGARKLSVDIFDIKDLVKEVKN